MAGGGFGVGERSVTTIVRYFTRDALKKPGYNEQIAIAFFDCVCWRNGNEFWSERQSVGGWGAHR